ncbi:ribbon-helix-helix protein, CopG family [Halocatena halophila]|uniref:ribbon-helix-helix protein, CopG family n=1 Tax=Halocatena halophila TaxID=2814576 RepID=UPI0038B3A63F
MEDNALSDDLQLRCSPELKRNVRVKAAKQGIPMSELVRRILRENTEAVETEN